MFPLSTPLDPSEQVAYLRTLPSIRERCSRVFEIAQGGRLEYFDYHPEKENDVRDYCITLIQRDYGSDFQSIPPHGRWRHFDVGGRPRINRLIDSWKTAARPVDDSEICRRLLDLFLVSVLLDAGAGNAWKYNESSTGEVYTRSEGLAIASLDLFCEGLLSAEKSQPYRVDSSALSQISPERLARAMQVDHINPLVGVEGRAGLLSSLGSALSLRPDFFGRSGRPGDMLDYLQTQTRTESGRTYLHVAALWHVVMEGLNPIWPPSRTKLNGVSMGDVWPCNALKVSLSEHGGTLSPGEDLVPFHKLSQWLTYSLLEVLQKVMNWTVEGTEDMTGLPEYRNGGLLIDLGVLSLRQDAFQLPEPGQILSLPTSHPAIVEWRAMTVIGLDRVANAIRASLGLSPSQLTLPQVLESATWKGGRELAKAKRPATGGPPLEIQSDGTLF